MEHLGSLLDSPDVDLRITAGEAIVMLFINASEHDEDEAYDSVEELIVKLKELATDSNKHRSKKDRKEQRSSFRDILRTIEDGSEYREKISFNTRESLELDGWFKKKHYDSLCKVNIYFLLISEISSSNWLNFKTFFIHIYIPAKHKFDLHDRLLYLFIREF